MSTLRILALDCAGRTGWAHNCGRIESGVQEFKTRRGASPGMRFVEFQAWLRRTMQELRPDVLVYEQAHHRGGAATEFCVGLVTHAQGIASELDVEYRGVHTATLKLYATCHGNAKKELMIEHANERFPGLGPCIDDNEADARLILAWAMDGFPERPKAPGRKGRRKWD